MNFDAVCKYCNPENGKHVKNAKIEEKTWGQSCYPRNGSHWFLHRPPWLWYNSKIWTSKRPAQSGSWLSNATFLDRQGGVSGHCIIFAPKWQFWPNISNKVSFGVRECFYYLVLGILYFGLPATLWLSNLNQVGSGIKKYRVADRVRVTVGHWLQPFLTLGW